MHLLALPAFNDNYIWMLHDGVQALVVDPGWARPVIDSLDRLGLRLACILVTHHHSDHVGGLKDLLDHVPAPVYGPHHPALPVPVTPCTGGEQIEAMGLGICCLGVPGHTLSHLAFHVTAPAPGEAPLLFCGDTLFSAGCGRLFEGSPAQMLASLERLAALGDDTRVCCAHEYTLSNLRFARTIEPANPDMAAHAAWCEGRRAQQEPTLPSTLALERKINPFLRCEQVAPKQAAHSYLLRLAEHERPCAPDGSALATFTALRHWKNHA